MNNQSARGIASPCLGTSDPSRITPVLLSLEERLDHLMRGVERMNGVRMHLTNVAQRLSLRPTDGEKGVPTPTPSDLNGRFGEVIAYVHHNVDALELLTSQIDQSLFDQNNNKAAAQAR